MNNSQKRMLRNREFIKNLKLKRGCDKCGYKKCSWALDFHHIDPATKCDNISYLCRTLQSIDVIEYEIAKCCLLCANCHRELEHRKI